MLPPAGPLMLLLMAAAPGAADDHQRHRRALVFGNNAVLQFTVGISLPLNIPQRRASMGYALQAQFFAPANATQLEPALLSRGGRGARALYRRLEEAAGHAHCVLRAVCEAAAEPLHRPGTETGLLAELLQLLLTPSEDLDEDGGGEGELWQYVAAERLGAAGGDCAAVYSVCATSPLDAVSQRVEPADSQEGAAARPDL